MKGHAFRKLSRTSSHRQALLRNLVTSLVQHERISTTVAKAKEAAREAEKIITLAKKDTYQSNLSLRAFLYSHDMTLPRLKELAQRYAERPGGYTRIHLHGNRIGDHAPRAILEFVDNPYDIRFQMTARTMAREAWLVLQKNGSNILAGPQHDLSNMEKDARWNPLTRKNMAKVVRYGGMPARQKLVELATEHFFRMKATLALDGPRRVDEEAIQAWGDHAPKGSIVTMPHLGARVFAGEAGGPDQPKPLHGRSKSSVVRIGKGAFAKRQNYRTPLVPRLPRQKSRSSALQT